MLDVVSEDVPYESALRRRPMPYQRQRLERGAQQGGGVAGHHLDRSVPLLRRTERRKRVVRALDVVACAEKRKMMIFTGVFFKLGPQLACIFWTAVEMQGIQRAHRSKLSIAAPCPASRVRQRAHARGQRLTDSSRYFGLKALKALSWWASLRASMVLEILTNLWAKAS